MGFLDKLRKKEKKETKITPPPPPPKKSEEKSEPTPPPSMPELKPMPKAQTTPPPKPETKPEPLKKPTPPPLPKAAPSKPESTPRPNLPPPLGGGSSDDVRKKMADLPPIKVDEEPQAVITNEHVKELDVDKFVLPGEDNEEPTHVFEEDPPTRPQPQPQPRPHPQARPAPPEEPGFSGPLYVDVKTYEDVQKLVDDLKGQLTQVRGDITSITKYRDKEDKEFAKVIAKLEKIQDDLLKVDEDLFEEQ